MVVNMKGAANSPDSIIHLVFAVFAKDMESLLERPFLMGNEINAPRPINGIKIAPQLII